MELPANISIRWRVGYRSGNYQKKWLFVDQSLVNEDVGHMKSEEVARLKCKIRPLIVHSQEIDVRSVIGHNQAR